MKHNVSVKEAKGKSFQISFGIGNRMSVYFLILLLLVIGICMIVSQYVYSLSQEQRLYSTSAQAVESILAGIHARISTADSYSYMILYDKDVQAELKSITKESYIDVYTDPQSAVNTRIGQILQTSPLTSIYLYTNEGYCFSGYLSTASRLNPVSLEDMSWYEQAEQLSGGLLVRWNAVGSSSSKNYANYLSLIRIIMDLEHFSPIGLAVLNIPESDIWLEIESMMAAQGSKIRISDQEGNVITNFTPQLTQAVDRPSGGTKKQNRTADGQNYFYYTARSDAYDWRIEYLTPLSEKENLLPLLNRSYLAIFVVAMLLVCAGTFLISRSITIPLKRLLGTMEEIHNGHFNMAQLPAKKDEVYFLIEGYNRMIVRINELIEEILLQEKEKRKYELEALHSQIKPHFLYNTFDTISYLALSAGNNELFTLIKALGGYYRTSLSHGSEVITLEKELSIVKDYLYILSYRYPSLFQCRYHIDEAMLTFPILRLTLQPFVENAIYHGLKPIGKGGHITITIADNGGNVDIAIQDDGVGMSSEKKAACMDVQQEGNHENFGIRGTIQRLQLYYGIGTVCEIQSEPGEGTTVLLHIPKDRLLSYGNPPQIKDTPL